jgi:hypothetical protein
LRLDADLLATFKRKAEKVGLPVNQLIVTILERECDDMAHYNAQMAAKHSWVTYALLNVLATKMLSDEVRKDVMKVVSKQSHNLFGPNPEIPDMIVLNRLTKEEYLQDLDELFSRYATNRWGLKPDT